MTGRTIRETPLDAEERLAGDALAEALDRGDVLLDRDRKTVLEASARATLNPARKPITTRLPAHDLSRLKARAAAMGIPYQTLLASIVHRWLEGTLVEK